MSETPTTEKKPPRWRRWMLDGLIFLALFTAFQAWQTRNAPVGPAPNFAGTLIDGQRFELTEWRQRHPGKAALIYFWAEWCGICRTTAGTVTSLSEDWPVITVAIQSSPGEKVAQTMQQHDYRWPTLPDPEAAVLRQYAFRGVPAFVIIDPDGNVRATSIGYTSEFGLRLRLWWANQTNS